MILYNEHIRGPKYPLVFLKSDSGKRVPALISTIVTNDNNVNSHQDGFCHVRATAVCINFRAPDPINCFFVDNQLFLPDGEILPVTVLSYRPYDDSTKVGVVEFTCEAHYE